MAIPGRNFCIAPFTQLTFNVNGGFSPCAEIGGRPWIEPTSSPIKMWSSVDFETLRDSFRQNEKNEICDRCWSAEKVQNKSLRQRLLSNGAVFKPGETLDFINSGYKAGPHQINIMTGNKCNLRCRICKAACSWTYNIEGREYEKELGFKTIYTSNTPKPISLSDAQLDEIFELSSNLRRLELYGGEPLLDDRTLRLLERLVDCGRSQDISIMYNTNGVNLPTRDHYRLWPKFKFIDFNISIDDIHHRYTYNRHPAKWSDLVNTIDLLRNANENYNVFSICTVSVLNIFYIPEILNQLNEMKIPCFLNTLFKPHYYEIQHLPMPIKHAIKQKLSDYADKSKINFLINMLDAPENLEHWENFKFWTRTKDNYRQENFAETYPEFIEVIRTYDKNI